MKRKNEVIYDREITGTVEEELARKKVARTQNQIPDTEFAEEMDAIQQIWRVNPADEEDYTHEEGYKDA